MNTSIDSIKSMFIILISFVVGVMSLYFFKEVDTFKEEQKAQETGCQENDREHGWLFL